MEFNSYERWIIRTGLTLIENQTQENLERQIKTYQGISDGEKIIQGNEELLREIKTLKNKIKA